MRLKNENKYDSLQTVRRIATLKATGTKFLNGISNKYDGQINESLKQMLTIKQQNKYKVYFNQLNYKINQYWPCNFAYFCGYLSCPFTCGLSLCLPLVCIKQVEQILKKQVVKINQDVLKQKKLQMRLEKQCYNSYLVIEQIDFSQFQI